MMTEVHDAGRPRVVIFNGSQLQREAIIPFASRSSCFHHQLCSRGHLLIIFLLLVSPFNDAAVDVDGDDNDNLIIDHVPDAKSSSEALLNFKSSLSTSSPRGHEVLGSWIPSNSPCSGNNGNWLGVLCYEGDVWGLQLENLDLSGVIDIDSLLPLHFLRTLSFMNNSFKGQCLIGISLEPSSHCTCPIIASPVRSRMMLPGYDLSQEALFGKQPIQRQHPHLPGYLLPQVFELSLENNRFTGSIPHFPPNVLKVLNLSNNQLEGPIPPALSLMDPTTFSGNKGLCGKPLESACNSPSQEANNPDSRNSSTISGQSSTDVIRKSPTRLSKVMLIVAVCLVVLCLLIVLILIIRRRSHSSSQNPQPVESNYSNNDRDQNAFTSSAPDDHVTLSGNSTYSNNQHSNSNKAEAPTAAVVGKLSFVRDDRPRFDLQDLLRASAEVLGSGNLGSSYKALLMDGQAVVVKRFKQMNHVAKEDFHEHMRRLGRLTHPNLLPLVAYYYRKEEKLLVYDYASNGSLASHLHGNQSRLDWSSRLKIVKGVAKALAYLHNELPSLALPHGHLKSSNVLLDKYLNPVLMDYTLVPLVNLAQVQHLLVAYKAPEYAQQGRITRKTDVWSLGILILETLTGKFPTNYLALSTGYGTELATWVDTIIRDNESAFDKEMNTTKDSQGQIRKLFDIGVACCQEDLDTRWDLKEVVQSIQSLNDKDHGHSNSDQMHDAGV
uniref:Pollen receptor-like kinase 1 n=1 Tax=Petunia integrifolia TaxID=4103 RepID=PRK1_PETIN|nr:RecName: Full=Pollen receptor-like kinase 1 [Petunia integrifolia]AAA33715.1 receptor kinase [Petunia integrifolia subsp. inflata]